MREIEIKAAQARLIRETQQAAGIAQAQAELVLRAVLAGEDAEGERVVKLDVDRNRLVVQGPEDVAAQPADNGTEPTAADEAFPAAALR